MICCLADNAKEQFLVSNMSVLKNLDLYYLIFNTDVGKSLTNSLYEFHGKFVGEAENLIPLGAFLSPTERGGCKWQKVVPLAVFENPTHCS